MPLVIRGAVGEDALGDARLILVLLGHVLRVQPVPLDPELLNFLCGIGLLLGDGKSG